MYNNLNIPLVHAQLPRLLLALDEAEVCAAVEQLAASYEIEDITLPQAGLGLLKIRDGAYHEAYFPGEIPLSSAHVALSANGMRAEGAAQILHDSAPLTRAVAIADAIFSASLPEKAGLEPLLQKGWERVSEQAVLRKKMLARTRVDFSLLGTAEEDDDE
jgi:alpha-D-ribose 1-methylphosphonate 5-triphosphate synthase subunit PhnG